MDDIGEDDEALFCVTDSLSCCRSTRCQGEFYFPDETTVPIRILARNFYRNRGNRFIRLNRRNSAKSPIGKYCCEIPDASGVVQRVYITSLIIEAVKFCIVNYTFIITGGSHYPLDLEKFHCHHVLDYRS